MMFRMLRLFRISNNFIPADVIISVWNHFFKVDERDEQIKKENFIMNLIKIIQQVLTTLMSAYIMGLLWYRFSDYWQTLLQDN
jgi:hypothetical protein